MVRSRSKRHSRSYSITGSQQLFSLCIHRFISQIGRILILAQCFKCRNCTVIVTGSKQLFCLGIVYGRNNNLHNNQHHREHGCQRSGNLNRALSFSRRFARGFFYCNAFILLALFTRNSCPFGRFLIRLFFCKRFLLPRGKLRLGFLQKSVIGVCDALFFRSRLLFGGLLLLAQEGHDLAAQCAALHFCFAVGKLLRTGKIAVIIQPLHGLFLRVAEICRPVGAIAPVKTQRCTDIRRVVILWHLIVLYARINKRLILCARLGIALRRRISGDPCTAALHIGLYVRPARLG